MPESFTAYSQLHGTIVAASVFATVLLIWLGRRNSTKNNAVLYTWIGFVIVVQLIRQFDGNTGGAFDVQRSLPLHICDIAPWIGIAALLWPRPWSRSLAYFWGFGLSVFAFLIPIVSEGPQELAFWIFWVAHFQIVATAAYLIWVNGYQPNRKDWLLACFLTAAYILVVLPINLWLGSDYGYVGERSVAGELAPWPARIPILWLVECAIFGLFLLPFVLRQRSGAQEGDVHA